MVLEWKIQTTLTLFAALLALPGFIISIIYYKRYKYRPTLYLGISCFFSFLISFLYAIADIFVLENLTLAFGLFHTGSIMTIPMSFCVVILIDSITRESLDPLKISVLSCLSGILFVVSFFNNSFEVIVYSNGDSGINFSGYMLPALASLEFIVELKVY